MFAGRTKILTIFALLGFVIGTTAYFVFNWFVTHNLIKITAISIIDILYPHGSSPGWQARSWRSQFWPFSLTYRSRRMPLLFFS